ncbi:protein msp1 [Fusarium sporotrichioides]|uniref:Protein msp1 n=1 Tax=Fusarium sporotrichioides TaxID=5514 RepID=A0A395RJ87_FUSSP|nr:protein msp1 [Fusarium sporotrichioides]
MAASTTDQEKAESPNPTDRAEEDSNITKARLTENDTSGTETYGISLTDLQLEANEGDSASPTQEPDDSGGFTERTPSSYQKSTKPPSDLMLELSSLRERLLFLEGKVGKSSDRREMRNYHDVEDDGRLRKQIRRARQAKDWVGKAEALANETREDRQGLGSNDPFLHHISESGGLDHFRSIGEGGVQFQSIEEKDLWFGVPTEPHRGLRPQTSLRPHYSRKLGPPTEWDISDSDEWSSDASIGTRDFDYFRARLRGDFEWELDRLNAQKRRFEKNKKKKQAKAETELRKQPQTDEVDEKGRDNVPIIEPTLNYVEWAEFRACRRTVGKSSRVIDVLVGEPQVLRGFFQIYKNKSSKQKVVSQGSKLPEINTQKGEGGGHGSGRTTVSDGRALLPERIRIHSKEIIKTLSIIHGSEIISADVSDGSIVMLRPYRLLTYYESEIRQWHSRLEERFSKVESGAETKPVTDTEIPIRDAETTDGQRELHEEQAIDLLLSEKGNEDKESPKRDSTEVEDPEGLSTSRATLEHMTCLLKFMDEYIQKRLQYLHSASCDKIFFSDIWHMFKPGDQVISADGKQVYQVFNVTSPPHIGKDGWSKFSKEKDESDEAPNEDYVIHCAFVHFDGYQIGPVVRDVTIPKFDGEKSVTSLSIYPLRCHVRMKLERQIMTLKPTGDQVEQAVSDGVAELRESLVKRGKLFSEVAGVKHMYYSGLTVDTRDEVQSQVMIDFEEAFLVEKNDDWRPEVKHLIGMIAISDSTTTDATCEALCCSNETIHNDSYVDNKRHHDFMKEMMRGVEDGIDNLPPASVYPRPMEKSNTGGLPLTSDELLITSYSVFGFVLRDRSWAKLDLAQLTHVTDSTEDAPAVDDETEDDKTAFGQLVLPSGHKKMVLSLISQHFRNKATQRERDEDEQVDIVRGKGKGLIILLHGAPGVGKTTTAEGVAEKFKKPLFQITCGDLGSSPKEVEDALQTNFALANRWGCILLLDEADVFLAERRRDDFNRNGLVAVFLRVLEYYAGILFLTTNRIGDFDEAFASRIHMSLHYPPLKLVSTSKIFDLNLNMIKKRYQEAGRKITIDIEQIQGYAEEYWERNVKARLNGRQIRNACQTALALAEFDAQPEGSKYDLAVKSDAKVHLTLKHIQTVSDAYLEFIEYLKAVHGTDAETHANETGLRALETAYLAMRSNAGHRGTGSTGRGSEPTRNPLHDFRIQGHSQQSPTQIRPDQGQTGHQYHQGPSYDPRQASVGSYSTPPRMGGPQPSMGPYGQTASAASPVYQRPPETMQTSEQYHYSGVQQHPSIYQQRSYSPSPSGSTAQSQYMTDPSIHSNMPSMYSEPFR